jgi:hypothetical protein
MASAFRSSVEPSAKVSTTAMGFGLISYGQG